MSNTPLNADYELREEAIQLVEYWDFSPQQDEDSRIERLTGQIVEIVNRRVLADRKKHELRAKKNGFYMAAGLFGADISRVEELWDKCEQELEK